MIRIQHQVWDSNLHAMPFFKETPSNLRFSLGRQHKIKTEFDICVHRWPYFTKNTFFLDLLLNLYGKSCYRVHFVQTVQMAHWSLCRIYTVFNFCKVLKFCLVRKTNRTKSDSNQQYSDIWYYMSIALDRWMDNPSD